MHPLFSLRRCRPWRGPILSGCRAPPDTRAATPPWHGATDFLPPEAFGLSRGVRRENAAGIAASGEFLHSAAFRPPPGRIRAAVALH